MHQKARILKPSPSKYRRHNIRSSSIRDIIGNRRFNDQFRHVNTHRTEGIKKVKRMKVGDDEVHDLPNSGRNASSIQSEATEDPRGCRGDFAAKTSEYAFFKRMKENSFSNINVNPNYHDNQLSNVRQSDHFTKEEIPNLQKESIKYARSSLPIEKEQNYAHYSFLSPPYCGSKNSEVNNVFGTNDKNIQNVKSVVYNWLSPSVGSKIKTSGNKGIFSAKREKLRHLAANKSLYNVDELSSERFDFVSALISRILPVDQDNNSHGDHNQDEIDYKYKLPSFSELESTTLIMSHEAYKRKLIKSQNILNLDDGFSRSTKKPIDMDLLEWNPTGSESFSGGHSPNTSIQYNRCHTEAYKRKFIKSHHISYLDDDFSRSTKKPIDMGILEWNPTGTESRNFQELDETRFYSGRKLLEPPNTLLLGWNQNSEEDESFLTSSTSPPLSPYINRHLKKDYLLTSSISPYTPKHLMAVEDYSIKFPFQDYSNWCMKESLIEKEHCGSESFLFLMRSPANKLLSVLNTGLHSFLVDDENEEKFLYDSDQFLKGKVKDYSSSSCMESFHDEHFDCIEYPLLLHDSSRNDVSE